MSPFTPHTCISFVKCVGLTPMFFYDPYVFFTLEDMIKKFDLPADIFDR